MGWLKIETSEDAKRFLPGEAINGTVSWHTDKHMKSLELRLFWYTQGKGDQDVGIVDSVTFHEPGIDGKLPFSLQLPIEPYSFSGRLITLTWALELLTHPSDEVEKLDIVMSPTKKEIILHRSSAPE